MFKIVSRFLTVFIGTCVMVGLPLAIIWMLMEWDYMSLIWICIILTIAIIIYGSNMKKRQ